jgi:hypothetical protein
MTKPRANVIARRPLLRPQSLVDDVAGGVARSVDDVAGGVARGAEIKPPINTTGGTLHKKLKLTVKEDMNLDWLPERYRAVQIEGHVKVGGKDIDVSRRVYQIEIDKNYKPSSPEARGMTNRELMEKGNSPYIIDSNGVESKVELHHLTQREPGNMIEIAETTHDSYTRVLHGLVDDGMSFRQNLTLRKQYENFRSNYWKLRAES